MQLNNQQASKRRTMRPIAGAITAASCALLGPAATAADGDFWDFSEKWRFDSGFLYYGETDRVSAVEGVFSATREADVNDIFNFKVVLDSLTGASPSGAVAQPGVQTFTRPSGRGQYDVMAGDIPLDDTFRDTRLQMNAQWTKPAWQDVTSSYGVHFSKEYDYLSLGLNGSLAFDFNQKNSTFSAGLSYASDTYEPEGGIPLAFAEMVIDQGQPDFQTEFDATRIDSSDTRTTTDLLLGWTQIINRTTIMQLNYSYSNVDGYLTDPFKIFSVVDGNGVSLEQRYEKRPDSRTKHSVFAQVKHHFDESVADVSLRLMTDDWEIDSTTVEYKHYFWLSDNHYIEPQFRFYQQSAAEFYKPYWQSSEPLPEYASADIRLGAFSAYTIGLKYGWKTAGGNDMAVRLSYYQQVADDEIGVHPGVLNDLEIYPDLDAVFLQVTYSF